MSGDGDEPAPAALWARVRERYEQGIEAVTTIAAEAGITRQALTARARGEGWKMRGYKAAAAGQAQGTRATLARFKALLQGGNLAAIGSMATGWEIVQFATAEIVGAQTWRLSLLLRGQFGSAPELRGLRPAGERFVLLDAAVVQPALSLAQAGLEQGWRLAPAYEDMGRAQTDVTLRGGLVGLRPLAPVRLTATRQGGDLLLRWIRQSRIGGDSWEASDVPLGEERELYRVEVLAGAQVRRSVTSGESQWLYRAAEIAADLGSGASSLTLRVAQLSTPYGAGAPLQETIHV